MEECHVGDQQRLLFAIHFLPTRQAIGISVFATKTSPQGAPLPTDHSIYNIYDSA